MSAERLRCHGCGSVALVLMEIREEVCTWDEGLLLDDAGRISGLGPGLSAPGSVLSAKTRIECDDCGKSWHPRRSFMGGAA